MFLFIYKYSRCVSQENLVIWWAHLRFFLDKTHIVLHLYRFAGNGLPTTFSLAVNLNDKNIQPERNDGVAIHCAYLSVFIFTLRGNVWAFFSSLLFHLRICIFDVNTIRQLSFFLSRFLFCEESPAPLETNNKIKVEQMNEWKWHPLGCIQANVKMKASRKIT